MSEFEFETLAIRAGIHRSQFNEHAEALYLTSSYVFESAAQAAARFANEEAGMVYSRYTNPTVQIFQERLVLPQKRLDFYRAIQNHSRLQGITDKSVFAGHFQGF